MNIYVYNNFIGKEQSRSLLNYALSNYLGKSQLYKDFHILKTSKGKPYVKIDGVHFNISHSKNFWVCAVGNENVGIDIEVLRERNINGLVKKYFTIEENACLEKVNQQEKMAKFFEIWTYKEAFSKFKGESIFDNIRINMVNQLKMKDKVCQVYFTKVDLGPLLVATMASMRENVPYKVIEIKREA